MNDYRNPATIGECEAQMSDRAIPSRLGGGALGDAKVARQMPLLMDIVNRIQALTQSAEEFSNRLADTGGTAEGLAINLIGAEPPTTPGVSVATSDSLFLLPPIEQHDGAIGNIVHCLSRLSDVLVTAEERRAVIDYHHRRLRNIA